MVYRKINSLKLITNKYLRFFSGEEQKSFLLFYNPTFNKKYCIKLDIKKSINSDEHFIFYLR